MQEIKQFKVKKLPSKPVPNAIFYVKADTDITVSTFITDIYGTPIPFSSGSTFSGVETINNSDGTLEITGVNNIAIKLSPELTALINSAMQRGDNISNFLNDEGYITTANLPKTKTEFNTSLTDGDFLFVGDVISYTNEEAQDAVGSILTDSTTIDFTYNDTTPTISANVKLNSIDATHLADGINITEFTNNANYETTSQLNIRDTNNRNRVNHTGEQPISTVTGLQTNLDLKQDNLVSGTTIKTIEGQSILGSGNIDITKSDVGLPLADNTSDASKSVLSSTKLTTPRSINGVNFDGTSNITINAVDSTPRIAVSEKAQANGVATLGSDGKVPNNQIPALAISETFPVSSQAQMLALSQADQGDVAIRSDISKSFILRQSPSSVLGNWNELLSPTDAVTSVAGKVGVVTLNTSDISGLQAQIDLKANDSDVIHKTGDTFLNSNDFDPLLSQNSDTIIRKRVLEPELSRFDPTVARIYGWGDSMTDGFSQVNYPTQLQAMYGYTVTNRGVGGETSTAIKNRLIAEPAAYSRCIIIWVGRNNIANPATIKADIAEMIATVGHTRYLVVSVLNGNGEPIGSTKYNLITSLNSDLKAIYGNKFVSLREFIVSKYNPSLPQDVIDFNNDIPPTSLRIDAIHLNTAGYKLVAEFFNQRIGNMMGVNGYFQSKDFKYYLDLNKVLHTEGNETFTGIKYSENTGSSFINGINLANLGTGSSYVLGLAVTSSGRGYKLDVSGPGTGGSIINRVGGVGNYYLNMTNGQALSGENWGTGTFSIYNSLTASTGNLFELRKNGTPTSFFNHNGILTTPSPIISTEPPTSAGTYNPLTWNTSTGRVEKITAVPQSLVTNLTSDLVLKAPLASPSLTGTPTAPTATSGTNTTQIATTAFVTNGIATADSQNVKLTGNQYIYGEKTFRDRIFFENLGGIYSAINIADLGSTLYMETGQASPGVYLESKSASAALRASNITDGKVLDFGFNGNGGNITNSGVFNGSSFVKRSTPANNILLAGGGDLAQNTAFNKNFGTTAGTVVEGNDSRILNGQTAFGWGNHAGLYPSLTGAGANGTWGINISGSASSATNWGGIPANFVNWEDTPQYLLGSSAGVAHYYNQQYVRNFLGLGSNAYNSTAYLPLSGGTVSGTITASPATLDTQLATLGQVKGTRPYKVYTALVSQTGTNAPTATALENTLGGSVAWSRIGSGVYLGELTGAFVNNKTWSSVSIGGYLSGGVNSVALKRFDNNSVILITNKDTLSSDNILDLASIEIRVYPSLE